MLSVCVFEPESLFSYSIKAKKNGAGRNFWSHAKDIKDKSEVSMQTSGKVGGFEHI